MSVSSTPASKLARPAPFTPKRPLSSSSSTEISRLARSNTSSSSSSSNSILSSTHKRYKASITSESRPRTTVARPKSVLATVPGSPSKNNSNGDSNGRPRTPGTPRSARGRDSPMLMPATSEMDVSNVDVEEVLVDSNTVEPGDISGEMDEAWLRAAAAGDREHGNQDKVMVSVRVRPSDQTLAWIPSSHSISLDPAYAKTASSSAPANEFHFDSILTGTPNKPVYTTVGRSHVQAAMEGYNAVIFAYGQTASGKTYTLTGDADEPGIIPRSMKDVFAFIRRTPTREYLLRCSYLEIYNESIHDLLAPPGSSQTNPVQIQGAAGGDIILTPLREEVVTSLKGVRDVLKRGEAHRRTACTDWNERSSRSHSVFRLVIESRERGNPDAPFEAPKVATPTGANGRHTPGLGGRQTPGMSGRQTPGAGAGGAPGGPRLQARGGRSVQTSVLSLIDLAGSEKATSDKERTREGKYINTSLLTLGSVIGTLAENAAKGKSDHVPYRNSKLTRMLQPSLNGNARISVICTINPDVGAIAESTSTLLFARRVKGVKLNAQKKEIVDTDALIEKYRKEIEDLKERLADKEAAASTEGAPSGAPVKRRLSAREKIDESKAMRDLNNRIQQLTKLILTSQTVDETSTESRPGSPVKVDFDMSPYQLQSELLAARTQLETQATQILSLEAALSSRAPVPPTASSAPGNDSESDQDKVVAELAPGRTVEDVEKEWMKKVDEEVKKRVESERWAEELVKELDKEKKTRVKMEEERRVLAAFVSKFDSSWMATPPSTVVSRSPKPKPFLPSVATPSTLGERQQTRQSSLSLSTMFSKEDASPLRMDLDSRIKAQESLLETMPEEEWNITMSDVSFELENMDLGKETAKDVGKPSGFMPKRSASPLKDILLNGGKENMPARG